MGKDSSVSQIWDRQTRRFVHIRIHRKFRNFTMVPTQSYINNLAIAESVRRVPGCVVECGTWRGGMIAGIAQLLGNTRQYYLFDSFEGLPAARSVDGASALAWQADSNGKHYYDNCTADESWAKEAMQMSGARQTVITKGWFADTLVSFRPPLPIAILRLDADWFESTLTCLECLYSSMSPNGVIIVDDYYTWDGCSRAVHRFLAQHSYAARISQEHGVCVIRPNFSTEGPSSSFASSAIGQDRSPTANTPEGRGAAHERL